jgi:hypothetical protein
MDIHYIDLIKEWVRLDNVIVRNNTDVKVVKDEVKKLEERVNDVSEDKKRIEKEITEYVQTENLEAMQLKISDGVITFSKKTTTKPMNQKFIRETLQKYADENIDENINHVKIFDYIISNIEKKIDYSISRAIKDK